MLNLLLLMTLLNVYRVGGQSSPQLNFHFVAPMPGRSPETHDVHMEEELDTLLYGLMCKSSGNSFTVRISLSLSSTDLIDEQLGLKNSSKGAKFCMFSKEHNPVKCSYPSFCTVGNNCVATLKSVCPKRGSISRWLNTEMVDVKIDQVGGEIKVVSCYARCEPAEEEMELDVNPKQSVSYLAMGFIVAGVILAASLLVIGVVVWKIKNTKLLDPERQKNHHVEFVK
ncbi:uncharacterized protein LOC131953067 [Physella acuta]|uniref:uncharacterized protein LOC131953067 n=1 Tax=Physella acuta TaxID=109671 RepID=UPI0027DD5770|nr:uncharacterized protein LOC131953067 [Physella acuta]